MSNEGSIYELGKLHINLDFVAKHDAQFGIENAAIQNAIKIGSKLSPSEIQFPVGFHLSLRMQSNCTQLASENFDIADLDDQAKSLLSEGHDAFVSASLKKPLRGDELMKQLAAENCIGTAEPNLPEQMSSIAITSEPLTRSMASAPYYILLNAGLVGLFHAIDENAFGKTIVNLGVVDTGVNIYHPDLRGIASGGLDDFGHGTMVAGTAAAPANSIGALGSMPFDVRIKSYKVNVPGSGTAFGSTISNGILIAAYDHMDVINVSWSGFSQGDYNSAIATAVREGSLLVGAAGNFSQYLPTNITIAGAISVGALNATNSQMAYYSNYGSGVELYTPGSYMTTLMNGGYSLATGTSIASPLVAGIGLMVSGWGKSHGHIFTPAAIESILESTSSSISTVHGIVRKMNPLAALNYLETYYP